MSWRNRSNQTGANEIAVNPNRRWGGQNAQAGHEGRDSRDYRDGGRDYRDSRDYQRGPPPPPQQAVAAPPAERKRKSRWGDESEKVELTGLPTAIAGNVNEADLKNYADNVRLEEISKKLRTNDFVPPERERSPSPPPTYDHMGRRANTRELRYKKRLEEERNVLVEKLIRNDPTFKVPHEYLMYKRIHGRPSEKVYIPAKEFPEIKFFGLLVGPRGNTLKGMERESGAKISIRGRGSVKEGKGKPGFHDQAEDEDLHCLVQGDTIEKVHHCVKLINQVIETACSTPEAQNDHKRNQLRELATLNGTLRDDENQLCQNCGNAGHRKWDCPEQRNFTANIVCRTCGATGHMARDCLRIQKGQQPLPSGGQQQNTPFDAEYANLMAELGGGPQGGNDTPTNQGAIPIPAANLPPWRNPAHWFGPNQRGYHNYQQPTGAPAGYDQGYGQQPVAAGYGQGYGY